jgi:hypothetical protein
LNYFRRSILKIVQAKTRSCLKIKNPYKVSQSAKSQFKRFIGLNKRCLHLKTRSSYQNRIKTSQPRNLGISIKKWSIGCPSKVKNWAIQKLKFTLTTNWSLSMQWRSSISNQQLGQTKLKLIAIIQLRLLFSRMMTLMILTSLVNRRYPNVILVLLTVI